MSKENKVYFFGQLKDITKIEAITIKDVSDTDELLREVKTIYPDLEKIKFFVAVNKKMIQENTKIESGQIIACMPPFSGG
ncbi:MoaD/ThiS family protein [Rhizosphaericola mali]|uniref:MoaD/ThiS family protein n=1 Tax=Rhizosphaericola mali TaxID=2545455 RepID=A0A5P2G2Q4_9BACT|nr:MoaD/ThiS family protein [Rhizosphaericola mali]QES88389.1 MoaD/ThiS family protein [Rhizosphaericola mali]